MVFQEPMTALNPTMRIGDQIAETMLIHHTRPAAAPPAPPPSTSSTASNSPA